MPVRTRPADRWDACAWCGRPFVDGARTDSKFCDVVCRKRSHRFTSAVLAQGLAPTYDGKRYAFAYADPPYPGKADYYTDQPTFAGEVDHRELVARLVADYPDGWALSTSSEALRDVLPLCPPGTRVASWHRRVRRVRAVRPVASWEPLLVYGGREYATDRGQTVLDRLVYEGRYASYPGSMIGMKPPEFAVWLFRQLNAGAGDTLADLYPGTGAITRAWLIWTGGLVTTAPRDVSRAAA